MNTNQPISRIIDGEVLRLRTAARAAHYNPDLPHKVAALAITAGIDPTRLAAVLTGRAPLGHTTRVRVAEVLAGAR